MQLMHEMKMGIGNAVFIYRLQFDRTFENGLSSERTGIHFYFRQPVQPSVMHEFRKCFNSFLKIELKDWEDLLFFGIDKISIIIMN